ncbi:MAG: hypothetical protein ACREU3_04985 [Steroidobacteraceae bacterium]
MKTYDKRDIAVELLDAAVSEHLDYGRYFAAYNLAAVAEELLSKFLLIDGKSDSAKSAIGMVKAMSCALGHPEGEDKTWRKILFTLKNRIKHMDSKNDRYVDANIEVSARQKILDAVTNLERLGQRRSKPADRFIEHLLQRRSSAAT